MIGIAAILRGLDGAADVKVEEVVGLPFLAMRSSRASRSGAVDSIQFMLVSGTSMARIQTVPSIST
jgi:hypothetical protein